MDNGTIYCGFYVAKSSSPILERMTMKNGKIPGKQKISLRGRRVLRGFAALICIGIVLFCALRLSNPEPEGFARQETEESLADEFIEALLKGENEGTAYQDGSCVETPASRAAEENPEETIPSSQTPFYDYDSFDDTVWYERDGTVYTPDYASGRIDCVLEIPKETIQIRRGVYTGSWDDIYHNLDIWMVTAARPDYVLGKTHYCIYGHNHPVQNLSFNRLKYIGVGDEFTLTGESGVYHYIVTKVFARSREEATEAYVDNFTWSSDKCFILTCGRDEYAALDLIVEGTLEGRYSLNAWYRKKS